jgi:hypothetical protein
MTIGETLLWECIVNSQQWEKQMTEEEKTNITKVQAQYNVAKRIFEKYHPLIFPDVKFENFKK